MNRLTFAAINIPLNIIGGVMVILCNDASNQSLGAMFSNLMITLILIVLIPIVTVYSYYKRAQNIGFQNPVLFSVFYLFALAISWIVTGNGVSIAFLIPLYILSTIIFLMLLFMPSAKATVAAE